MKKNNFRGVVCRIIAMALCMLLATLALASCNSGEGNGEATDYPTVKVVRALKDIEAAYRR